MKNYYILWRATVNAIKDFQTSQGLEPDGTFGQASFDALQTLLNLEPLAFDRTLKEGMEGEDVTIFTRKT